MTRFNGSVAIVTGAGSGIGRATALRLGTDGATVMCADVAGSTAEATAEQISAAGGEAAGVACDIRDEDSVARLVERATELGTLRIVANVAGIGSFDHTTDVGLETWQNMIDVNLTGTFLVCREAIPHLLEHDGNIVNVASTAGVMGQPYSAAYCASKGGVVLLTKALAAEYIDRRLRVNAVAPGGINTPLIGSFRYPEGSNEKLFDALITDFGFAEPEDVANVIAFVASDEASHMTGAVVPVDGGVSI